MLSLDSLYASKERYKCSCQFPAGPWLGHVNKRWWWPHCMRYTHSFHSVSIDMKQATKSKSCSVALVWWFLCISNVHFVFNSTKKSRYTSQSEADSDPVSFVVVLSVVSIVAIQGVPFFILHGLTALRCISFFQYLMKRNRNPFPRFTAY